MQEEVEQRIVSLMISCGKLGEQEFRKAVAKLLEQLKNGHQKHQYPHTAGVLRRCSQLQDYKAFPG